MIITEKDLGLIIIGGSPSLIAIKNGLNSLFSFKKYDVDLHLAFKQDNSFLKWNYATSDTIKEFNELFTYKEWIELDNSSALYYSEQYNIIFEGDEASLLYWKMKYLSWTQKGTRNTLLYYSITRTFLFPPPVITKLIYKGKN